MRKVRQSDSWVVYSSIIAGRGQGKQLEQVVMAVCDEADWQDAKQSRPCTLIQDGFKSEEEAESFLRMNSREILRQKNEKDQLADDAAAKAVGDETPRKKKKPARFTGP
ncbi:hypothetical protein BH11PLA2_BH11PLA2_46880 [soil metagenome]